MCADSRNKISKIMGISNQKSNIASLKQLDQCRDLLVLKWKINLAMAA